jgi:hypothetical protein
MLSLVLLLSMPLAAPTLAVSITVTGYPDSQPIQDRIRAEVAATANVLIDVANDNPECVTDPRCARNIVAKAGVTRMIAVDMLRAGSRSTILSRIIDASGAIVAQEASVVTNDAVAKGAVLLPPAIVAQLVPSKTPTPMQAAPTTPTPTTTVVPANNDDETSLGMTAIAGIAVVAVGALLVIGGGGVAFGQNALRTDRTAAGDARAATATTIPAAVGVAALGAIAVGAGVFLLVPSDTP